MIALADEETVGSKAKIPLLKHVITLGLFSLMGGYLAWIVPTVEIAWVTTILLLTIYLFAFEVVEVDVWPRRR